jgi:hypothetical protein
MLFVRSRNRVAVRLTEERWQHITRRHPEMAKWREQVLDTVAQPDCVQAGDYGALLAVRWYAATPVGAKYLVVVYREVSAEDGFVLTAYFTGNPSAQRTTLWKR